MTWKMYGDEMLEEGLNKGLSKGLNALVRSLQPLTKSFEELYNTIKANPEYADVTQEQVREYYKD